MIKLNEFKEKCKKGFCLRRTIKSKQCKKESKQDLCYDKYIKKLNDVKMKSLEKDYEWEAVKEELWLRDGGCLVEQILTIDELKEAQLHDEYWLQKFIDGAHILSRKEAPDHIYLVDNVILLGRFFHKRLDNHQDLITGEQRDFNCKKEWITRIMQQKKYWNNNYSYENFRKDLLGY